MRRWFGDDWPVVAVVLIGSLLILVAGCQSSPFQQVNHPPEDLGLPMQHLKVTPVEKVDRFGEVEM